MVRVRDHDDSDAWRQFVEAYAPLVVSFARKRGFQDADAADLAQDVLQKVAKAISRFEYDPQHGTFRSWLYRITRNTLADHAHALRKHASGNGDPQGQQLVNLASANDELEQQWDREHASHMLRWAMKRLQADFAPKTIEAFQRTVLEEQKAASVAKELGISVGAVYIAKSRAMVRLREILLEVDGPILGDVV